MGNLRILKKQEYKTRFLVTEEGITKEHYIGVSTWNGMFAKKNRVIHDAYTEDAMIRTFKQHCKVSSTYDKRPTDIIRKLTLEEYMAVNRLLQSFHYKYNKKKNILIKCCNLK